MFVMRTTMTLVGTLRGAFHFMTFAFTWFLGITFFTVLCSREGIFQQQKKWGLYTPGASKCTHLKSISTKCRSMDKISSQISSILGIGVEKMPMHYRYFSMKYPCSSFKKKENIGIGPGNRQPDWYLARAASIWPASGPAAGIWPVIGSWTPAISGTLLALLSVSHFGSPFGSSSSGYVESFRLRFPDSHIFS